MLNSDQLSNRLTGQRIKRLTTTPDPDDFFDAIEIERMDGKVIRLRVSHDWSQIIAEEVAA